MVKSNKSEQHPIKEISHKTFTKGGCDKGKNKVY